MEGRAKKCVERYCEVVGEETEQLYTVSTPCSDDHYFKKEELESVGVLFKNMLLDCLDMLVFGTNWWTRHSLACQQTGSSSHVVDKRLVTDA